MKKISIMALVLGSVVFTSCNPAQEDTYKNDNQATITAEQLKNCSSVTVEQENGQNVNYIFVKSTAAAPIQWNNGVETSANPAGEFLMLVTGQQTVTVSAMNPDGSVVKAEFPVNIEKLSDRHPVDPHWGMLCGTMTKDWVWDDSQGACWGNCGNYSGTDGNIGTWWGVPSGDIAGQVDNYGYHLNDTGDATMTFSLAGTQITKSTGGKGMFSFDFTPAGYVDNNGVKGEDADPTNLWAIGQLKATGDGILFPVQINTGTVVTQFNVNYMDEDRMVLTYASDGTGGWGEATYWRFRAK